MKPTEQQTTPRTLGLKDVCKPPSRSQYRSRLLLTVLCAEFILASASGQAGSMGTLEVAGMVGATAFNTTSDRAAKQDFTVVDAQAVLAKVVALPITHWRSKTLPAALHLGPTAQDFRAAFGMGSDDQSIATVDADGVTLAAIQGLNEKVDGRMQQVEAKCRTWVSRITLQPSNQ